MKVGFVLQECLILDRLCAVHVQMVRSESVDSCGDLISIISCLRFHGMDVAPIRASNAPGVISHPFIPQLALYLVYSVNDHRNDICPLRLARTFSHA